MKKITITEALAELKTIGKRVGKKQKFITQFLVRQDKMKDPLVSEGGSEDAVKRERQAIADLHQRSINIRLAIGRANAANTIKVSGTYRSIAEWLVWRREVAPHEKSFLGEIAGSIQNVRSEAQKQGLDIVQPGAQPETPNDIIVNVHELELAQEIEGLEETLGVLDGLLSLANATIKIEI